MTEELKSCPFCGSRAEVVSYEDDHDDLFWQIFCIDERHVCKVHPHTMWHLTEQESRDAWNRRVNQDE